MILNEENEILKIISLGVWVKFGYIRNVPKTKDMRQVKLNHAPP